MAWTLHNSQYLPMVATKYGNIARSRQVLTQEKASQPSKYSNLRCHDHASVGSWTASQSEKLIRGLRSLLIPTNHQPNMIIMLTSNCSVFEKLFVFVYVTSFFYSYSLIISCICVHNFFLFYIKKSLFYNVCDAWLSLSFYICFLKIIYFLHYCEIIQWNQVFILDIWLELFFLINSNPKYNCFLLCCHWWELESKTIDFLKLLWQNKHSSSFSKKLSFLAFFSQWS